jgi:hypothetical protein
MPDPQFKVSSVTPQYEPDADEPYGLECWVHITLTADVGEQEALYERAYALAASANALLKTTLKD